MGSFIMFLIMGILMIIGGISLMATPLITFLSTGYFVIIMFFLWGLFGIVRGFMEKRYDRSFFFAILSLILGIVGFVVPGAAAMNNFIILYMAAAWFFIHAILTIVDSIKCKGESTGMMVLGIVLGVLELALAIYSVIHPSLLALNIGLLIGIYFIESGINLIVIGHIQSQIEQ